MSGWECALQEPNDRTAPALSVFLATSLDPKYFLLDKEVDKSPSNNLALLYQASFIP